ncbi:MAG TPA: hypothetical protein DDZ89_14735, partial [Clostridiales bacterium]|nr:hypothetical protein [Clostridiales bacterium]
MELFVHNKKLMKFGTFLLAFVFILNSFVASVFAEEIVDIEIPDDEPNSMLMTMAPMAIGPNAMQAGTMTSTKGFIRKPIPEPTSDDYYINFHYMYPTGAGMNGFALWGSFDGKEYDDIMLYQTDNVIDARVGNNVREYIDIKLTPDVWHNILIHVKADNTVEMFINGVQAKIGNAYSQPQLGTGKMTALGYCGDLSTAAHNGMAYYDNIRVFSKDEIYICEDFNGAITGWTYYTTAFPANPPVNIDMPVLQSVELTAEREGLLVGSRTKLELQGVLNDGTYAVLEIADSVTVESSNPEALVILQEGDVYYAHATVAGTATVTASIQIQGVTVQGTLDIVSSVEPIVYGINLEVETTTLLTQDMTKLHVKGLLTDDTTIEIQDDVTIDSSNPTVVSVSMDETGAFYATAVSKGQTDVIARTLINGKQKEARITISVVDFDHIELSANTGLFIGDTSKIHTTAFLSDGSVLPGTYIESIECQSSDEQIATVTLMEGVPVVSMVGPGTAQIAVQVTFRGTRKSAVLNFTGIDFTNDKTRSTYYTDEKVAAARRNVEIYDWANSTKNAVVSRADSYVALGYEYLWNLVTPQSIPRGYGVNQTYGCLNCGNAIDAYGNYPYRADHVADPWKLECPNCRMKFPTNDFGAYYESGKDEHGIFNPELADRSLLVNTSYPEKGASWGVDDGYGYTHTNGRRYTFIAYYNHWHLWHGGIITTALNNLRDAYVYTGDMKYARAGTILLDRVADVYPAMDIWPYKIADGFLNSNGNSNRGKVVGSIWETGLARDLVKDYDAFFPGMDDQEIVAFLTAKSEQYDLGVLKKSAVGIRKNMEDGIVRQIYPAVKDSKIRGNNGMHQSTLAMAAVVMDTMPETQEWLDFNFQSGTASGSVVTGGNILATFVNDVDRDGNGNEASPGYNRLWLGQYIEVANILDGYDLYPAADLYDNPKFKKMFYSMISVMLTDKYSALIGDTGSTGNPAIHVNKDQTILAFERYGDPLLAQVIYFLNGNQTDGIHGNIFSNDPDGVANDIKNIIETYGPLKLESENVTGYGLAVMRDGDNITIDFGINYEFMVLPISSSSVEVKMFPNNRTAQLEAIQGGEHVSFLFD